MVNSIPMGSGCGKKRCRRGLLLVAVGCMAFGVRAESDTLTVDISEGTTRDYTSEELASLGDGTVTAIAKKGAGTLELRHELSNYTGTFSSSAGKIAVYVATNAFGLAGDGLVSLQNSCITLNGTTIERPVYVHGAYNDTPRFIVPDGTVNEIAGLFKFDSPRLSFNGSQGIGTGTLILSGGAEGTTFRPYGWGFLIVTNKPLKATTFCGATFRQVTFAVAGNDIGYMEFQWGNVLATAANAFSDTMTLQTQSGGNFNLGGFDQRIGTMRGSGGSVTSATKATLTFTQAIAVTNTAVGITGALSLHKLGSATYAIGVSVASTGDLTVEEGVFAVISAGSWAKVGKVSV